jgi:hypothetical protein
MATTHIRSREVQTRVVLVVTAIRISRTAVAILR